MPWRETTDAYKILVSEIMLQQTQVSRVIPKYLEFIKVFPTVKALASASPGKVIGIWQGLGYNRRAVYLHTTAKIIFSKYFGKVPLDENILRTLPGVGKGTAGALITYAANRPSAFVETNIRSVFIHHFFTHRKKVKDAEILTLVSQTFNKNKARDWGYALMDYGSYLKEAIGNNVQKSLAYKKQSAFKGSDREVRGMIIRLVSHQRKVTVQELKRRVGRTQQEISRMTERLAKEGLIAIKKGNIMLP